LSTRVYTHDAGTTDQCALLLFLFLTCSIIHYYFKYTREMWDVVKRMVLAVVNNSLERAIKEDSLSESSTKSTTSHSITVWKTGRWAYERSRGERGWVWDAGEECSPPSTLATGDSRISINPDYKSNSLNTKVTRKGNPTHTIPRPSQSLQPPPPPASKSFPLYTHTHNNIAAARNIKPDKENALIFPKSFSCSVYTRATYTTRIMRWIKLPRAMLINKRGHYCELIYINTAVVVILLLSLRKTRLSRIIKVQGWHSPRRPSWYAHNILLHYTRAYTVRTRDCLRWRDSNSPSPEHPHPPPNLTPSETNDIISTARLDVFTILICLERPRPMA